MEAQQVAALPRELRLVADRRAGRVEAAELQEREGRLAEAWRLEAIGRLATGIAHDFNNLLSIILSCSSLLGQELGADHAGREDLEMIQDAARRGAALTAQLLSFSRSRVLEPSPLSLNDIVGDVQRMLARALGADVELVVHLAEDRWTVRVDRGQIEQVLLNLAINARDAMPGGGRLTIETRNVALDEVVARSRNVAPGSYVLLMVSDTGIGMDTATLERIFEPFFTTKREKGTGLGLATVYEIVKQNGEDLRVDSAPGVGSTFRIYLPTSEEEQLVTAQAAPRSSLSGEGRTILLVEDDGGVRRAAVRILEEAAYEVVSVGQPERAIDACRHRNIDLVVSDVVMPGLNGPDLVSRIRIQYPSIRVLFMSGHTGDSLRAHAGLGQGALFLEKPFGPDALLSRVEEALGMRRAQGRR